ncbi:unnamed protein product [Symbiodinium pilosum]|uniref:Saccharopine dehydrogenase NADP binding domain-containing protein n=1 Tax=Symbiodinium pilosum TaxID=2952 RepID=A0A812N6E7_SYMPI|nr:unnamed protein product [Symbiodinium pilosum]
MPIYDVVVLGATGFTGRLACEYLANRGGEKVTWAMAGRSLDKLEGIRKALPESAKDTPLIKVDVTNPADLEEAAKSCKTLMNFAGTPYSDKGLPVVEACVNNGCCYVDITGEVAFVKSSADRYDEKAKEKKSLIVHCCGFDSIPSDIGAFMAATEMKKRHNMECARIRTVFGKQSGSFSGGTLESGAYMLDNPNMEGGDAMKKPYGLDPPGGQAGPDTGDFGSISALGYDEDAEKWVMPFVMAPVNTRIVRRSNALKGYPYGSACSIGECMEVPGPVSGSLMVSGIALFGALFYLRPTRWLLQKTVLPAAGEGPSKETREKGFFEMRAIAVGEKAAEGGKPPKVVAQVKSGTGGDPGYKCTALMSVEAALCCSLQKDKCSSTGGVTTPAAGLGQVLVDRLNAAGMSLSVDAA